MFGSLSGEGTLAKKSLQFLQNIPGKGLVGHEAHLDLPLTIILKSGLSPNLQYILKKCGKTHLTMKNVVQSILNSVGIRLYSYDTSLKIHVDFLLINGFSRSITK